jgi:hypothetical protein
VIFDIGQSEFEEVQRVIDIISGSRVLMMGTRPNSQVVRTGQ